MLPWFTCGKEAIRLSLQNPCNEDTIPIDGLLFFNKHASYIRKETSQVQWVKPYMVPDLFEVSICESFLQEKPAGLTVKNLEVHNNLQKLQNENYASSKGSNPSQKGDNKSTPDSEKFKNNRFYIKGKGVIPFKEFKPRNEMSTNFKEFVPRSLQNKESIIQEEEAKINPYAIIDNAAQNKNNFNTFKPVVEENDNNSTFFSDNKSVSFRNLLGYKDRDEMSSSLSNEIVGGCRRKEYLMHDFPNKDFGAKKYNRNIYPPFNYPTDFSQQFENSYSGNFSGRSSDVSNNFRSFRYVIK